MNIEKIDKILDMISIILKVLTQITETIDKALEGAKQ